MIGRLLCHLGLHKWRHVKTERLPGDYIKDRVTCKRSFCRKSVVYTTHRSDPQNW